MKINWGRTTLSGASRGQTLIEVLIALLIFSVIATAFMGAAYTSRAGVTVQYEQTTAESLTRSEMEYIKQSPYWGLGFSYQVPGSAPPWDESRTALADHYSGFSVTVAGTPIDASTHNPLAGGLDQGMQEITVQVFRGATLLLTTKTIKVNR